MKNKSPQIAGISAWVVSVPLLHEWICSEEEFGAHSPNAPATTLLRLRDEDGFEGWGEIHGNQLSALEKIAPILLQTNPATICATHFDLHGEEIYWARPKPPSPHAADPANLRHRLRHPLQSPVEQAFTDLSARRAGLSVSQFFGGRWRSTVPMDYWVGRATPEFAKKCAARGKKLGFHGIKFKTTLEDPNVERLEAIRDAAGPDFSVTVDPNGRFYRLDDAWEIIRDMDRVGNMKILEDPFPRFHLQEFAALRPRINARLVIHLDPVESFWSVVTSGAVGGLNIDSGVIGPFQWRILAGAAEQANLPVWHGGGHDLGIGTAWHLQIASTAPNCRLPGDQSGPWLREHSLIKESFEIKDGCVCVPSGWGIGVQADVDAIDKYCVAQQTWQSRL